MPRSPATFTYRRRRSRTTSRRSWASSKSRGGPRPPRISRSTATRSGNLPSRGLAGCRVSQDQVYSRRDAQLRVRPCHVRFDGAPADVELAGNFPGGSSLGNKLRHLTFSLCQRLQLVVQGAKLGGGPREPGGRLTPIVLSPSGHG